MKTLGLRDIIGPVMVGPSSSHTAGALAIASMARKLCGSAPKRVVFKLFGSFAHTGSGHGTDKALVAGIIGLDADDLAIRDSFELAREKGIDVRFVKELVEEADHPNTVDIFIEEEAGGTISVRGASIGGGAAVITRIDGIDVDITGAHTSIVVRQKDERGVLAHIAGSIAECGINIATTRMYRTRRGATAYTVMETDDDIPLRVRTLIEAHEHVRDVRIIPAMNLGEADAGGSECPEVPFEEAEAAFERCDFISGAGLLERCGENGCSIGEAFRMREESLASLDGKDAAIDAYLDRVLAVMRESAVTPIDSPTPSTGGLIGGEARALSGGLDAKGAAPLLDPLTVDAARFALAVLETNASMGRIVAAPTAGSAGVVPAVLLALSENRGFDEDDLKRGLMAAAAIGYLVARNASVSGAEGGCQAEIGSAAGMAAAAAVEMAHGTPRQALAAASNAITSLMGLVCDPIGGLVEVPCQKRNASAAACALVSAQIALAGVDNLVGFDETVAAMDAVGRTLPFELRESALGGIAAAPSACSWCKRCE